MQGQARSAASCFSAALLEANGKQKAALVGPGAGDVAAAETTAPWFLFGWALRGYLPAFYPRWPWIT